MSIWVGRYAMVGGAVREHGPWLVDRRRTREDEQVRLLVLAEPVDERSAEFAQEVAEAVAALFGRESLSITGGLLRALQQAHANLAEWNRRSLREHQVAVGLTCVAIRDGVATIGQVGPGAAYLARPGHIERYGTEESPAELPLGADGQIEPQFQSVEVAGQPILLLTSAAEAAVGGGAIARALEAGPERALAELFVRTREVPDMTAVLIADLDVEEEQTPPPVIPTLPEENEGRELVMPVPEPARSRRAAPEPEPSGARARWLATAKGAQRLGRPEKPEEPDRHPMPRIRSVPQVTGRRARIGPALPWRWIGIAAAAVVALGLLAWAVLPGILQEDRGARLETLIASAGAQLEVAQQRDDPAGQREAYQLVLEEASRARALEPEDPRIAVIENEARAGLAVLDAIVTVSGLRGVLTFDGTITAPFSPGLLIAGGDALWLTDAERGRVFRVDPAGRTAPVEIYRAGQRYGGVAATPPVAIAWEQGTQRLLILDEARQLFAVAAEAAAAAENDAEAGPQPLPLRDATELASVAGMVTYAGNLYLLDPQGGEVWRYLPAGTGYDSERAGLLGELDVATATGLAVDGDVYLLEAQMARRFRQGMEQARLFAGIDEYPTATVGIVVDGVRGLAYVGDRAGRRVVVSDRGGSFLRQFRHAAFLDIRGIALAGDGETLYVLSGDGIAAFDPLQLPPTSPSASSGG